jgi:hypothetical protein
MAGFAARNQALDGVMLRRGPGFGPRLSIYAFWPHLQKYTAGEKT